MANESIYRVVPVTSVASVFRRLGESAQDWFCLTRRGRSLKTPGGILLANRTRPLLEGIRAEAESEAGLRLRELSVYSMFCTMKDHIEKERHENRSCKYLVLGDLTLRLCAGPEATEQLARLGPVKKFFSKNRLPRLSLSQSGDGVHQEQNLIASGCEAEMNTLVNFFETLWPTLSPARQCVVTNCVHRHDVFILGILLAQSKCSPAEYADALLALQCLIPGVFGGVSRRVVNSSRRLIIQDAKLMIQFRDSAEA